jgi:hypothetical protein
MKRGNPGDREGKAVPFCYKANKGNNKIPELRTILRRESQNS